MLCFIASAGGGSRKFIPLKKELKRFCRVCTLVMIIEFLTTLSMSIRPSIHLCGGVCVCKEDILTTWSVTTPPIQVVANFCFLIVIFSLTFPYFQEHNSFNAANYLLLIRWTSKKSNGNPAQRNLRFFVEKIKLGKNWIRKKVNLNRKIYLLAWSIHIQQINKKNRKIK